MGTAKIREPRPDRTLYKSTQKGYSSYLGEYGSGVERGDMFRPCEGVPARRCLIVFEYDELHQVLHTTRSANGDMRWQLQIMLVDFVTQGSQ